MTGDTIQRPADVAELRALIADAAGDGRRLELRGGGSKREIGRADRETTPVDMRAFAGVIDYEPSELVLTAGPATPLAEVEALLAARGQMLAFEPFDHGPLFGRAAGAATLGGVVAAGVAGSRRVSAGGARDHLLGFAAVSGRGEAFRGGGKVVKNVTGYDISKLIAGSWGQLAAVTELTVKLAPRPRAAETVALAGLSPDAAVAVMACAMGSRCAPVAAGHLPGAAPADAITAVRLEGFRESVDVRAGHLAQALADHGDAAIMGEAEAAAFWRTVGQGDLPVKADTLWRVHLAPSRAVAFARAVEAEGARWCCDWAGALVWVAAPVALDVHAAAAACGGHATLLRAPAGRGGAVRQPVAPALAALSTRLAQAFDPAGVLDPNRFG